LRTHHSLFIEEHTKSLQSVIKKTSLIDTRRKKASEKLNK